MRPLYLTITAAMAALAIGCVEGGSSESELAGDELDQTEQAIGDVGCGTISMSGMAAADGIIRSTLVDQESPDWTYNPGTSCPYQYLVEYTNLPADDPSAALRIKGKLGGDTTFNDITNQTDCERTHLQVGYYVWNTSSSTPTITTYQEDGLWATTQCFGSIVGAMPAADGKFKIRVAARVLYCAFSDGCTVAQRTNLKVGVYPQWF
ncbi:hypothetical protein WME99_22690 [Sorangium sp. So ce136]|uniref:hypothetical protein n=1 Tax=Sorangium sp. So ce136 TaxID=3133284 RepID=UPI003F05D68D